VAGRRRRLYELQRRPRLAGVKPVDDNQTSNYQNSDHAGTPESFKASVTGGATGGGGSNYTGSYSPTVSVTPVVVPEPTSVGTIILVAASMLTAVRHRRCSH